MGKYRPFSFGSRVRKRPDKSEIVDTVKQERRRRCSVCKNQDICGLYGKSDDPSCYEIVQKKGTPHG